MSQPATDRDPVDILVDVRVASVLVIVAAVCRALGYGFLVVALVALAGELTFELATDDVNISVSPGWATWGVVLQTAAIVLSRHVKSVLRRNQ
jgi:hypothetical protein